MHSASDLIKAYSQDPISNYEMKDYTFMEELGNSVCGDTIIVYLKINDKNRVEEFSHAGNPQMFTLASASMLAEVIEGEDIETILSRGGNYMSSELGLNVSPRRKRSTVSALLAVHNGINKRLGKTTSETYEQILEY